MYKLLSASLIFFFLSACKEELTSLPHSCDKDAVTAPNLISITEARQLMAKDHVVIVDVGKEEQFETEHIKGAVNIWRPDFRSKSKSAVSGMRCSKEELEALLAKMGVTTASSLLIYDRKGLVEALRFAWILELHGYKNYKVMNGGMKAWKLAGQPTEAGGVPQPLRTEYRLEAKQNLSMVASLKQVKAAITDPQTIILDTREPYEYLGQPFIIDTTIYKFKRGAMVSGCIPTAIHLNWSDLVDLHGDHRMKCERDLIFNLEQAGVTPDKKIIVYCQSGSRSAHTAYVLSQVLNFPSVKNYDGSWIEWSRVHKLDGSVSIEQKTSPQQVEDLVSKLEQTLVNKATTN